MGEVFSNNKSKLTVVIFLLFMILSVIDVCSSDRELDIFERGYEYYLSYQPAKAAEEFKIFLTKFPCSSVGDAAMFWLGKSSLQLKEFEEARKVFSDMGKLFPESPYIKYVKKELEMLDKTSPDGKVKTAREDAKKDEEGKKGEPVGSDAAEIEKNILPAEKDLPKVPEDKAPLADDEGNRAPLQPGAEGRAERKDYAVESSLVLSRLDIRDVLWRSGNISEDIQNEGLLFEEAKRLNILIDNVKYDELVLKYEFDSGQADYLKRYLTICELIDSKLKGASGERAVESLVVHYGEGDKYRKIVIAPELQKEARNGTPFEDIQGMYPDLVKVVISAYDSIDADLKEKIRYLQDNEIGVIWSEDGYQILKPVSRKLSYKPFEEAGPGIRNEIKAFVAEWLGELKKTGK